MHAVVANELATRKEEVTLVTLHGHTCIRRDKTLPGDDVERPLIQLLVEKHTAFIENNVQGQVTSHQ